jgi:hypothetical protein
MSFKYFFLIFALILPHYNLSAASSFTKKEVAVSAIICGFFASVFLFKKYKQSNNVEEPLLRHVVTLLIQSKENRNDKCFPVYKIFESKTIKVPDETLAEALLGPTQKKYKEDVIDVCNNIFLSFRRYPRDQNKSLFTIACDAHLSENKQNVTILINSTENASYKGIITGEINIPNVICDDIKRVVNIDVTVYGKNYKKTIEVTPVTSQYCKVVDIVL